MYRDLFVEVNTDNLKNNINNIIEEFNDYKYYIGVVKGNCYGLGLYTVKYMEEAGINYFAVSNLDEALKVREYTEKPVLCLEPIDINYLSIAAKNNISITVSSYNYYKELIKEKIMIKVHLKINTGMNRLGVSNIKEINEIYENLINNKSIKLEGIYTHFATTGIRDKMYDNQLDKFKELTKDIDLSKIEIVHLGRSCTLELHPKIPFANGIRLGLVMYGIGQSFNRFLGFKGKLRKIKYDYIIKKNKISKTYNESKLSLRSTISLKTKIVEINKVKKDEKVGYGCTFTANKDTYIAVCEVGYADGLSLLYKNSKVLINNNYYNIVGIINMGMITIEVDDKVKINDIVTIMGDGIDIKRISLITNTTPYVAMTSISSDIIRIYTKNNKVDKIVRKEANYEEK